MSTNHVDGEIWVTDYDAPTPRMREEMAALPEVRVPVEPTDLDYRAAALNAAVNHYRTEVAHTDHVIYAAQKFEHYLRTGQTP